MELARTETTLSDLEKVRVDDEMGSLCVWNWAGLLGFTARTVLMMCFWMDPDPFWAAVLIVATLSEAQSEHACRKWL